MSNPTPYAGDERLPPLLRKAQRRVRETRAPAAGAAAFFEHALVMEGDTEFGLVLKNSLDAIGPLWGRGR